ncbi:MAG: HdeD family acid-resistance protein [Tepidisphaeraceae bacterium]
MEASRSLADHWWAFVVRGIAAILFGLLTFIMPTMALMTLVFVFGFYALTDGVLSIAAAFRRTGPAQTPWWALLISGLVSVLAGLLAFFMPGKTAVVLLYLIAAWAIVMGIISIIAAITLRKLISGEWVLILSGLLSIAFGVLMLARPGLGALAVVLWIGAYAVVFGAMLIGLGFELRKFAHEHPAHPRDDFPAAMAH